VFLGLDLGTSAVKVVVIDDAGAVLDQATAPLAVSRPRALWSEQQPEDWWRATITAVRKLATRQKLQTVAGIGLSGQMHGAVALDAADRILRPAILWNDGRSAAECTELERREPHSRKITGNLAMPGFTAPKLLWLERHEPDVFAATRRVLLPKDWLRLRLVGEAVSEMSDAAGTLWLDVARRAWSPAMLAATHLEERHMARLVEGTEVSGQLRADAAAELGLSAGIPVAGGAGDNAAGAAGIGVVAPGQAFLSLGTSGVIFVTDAAFRPDPERAVHTFCHCLPRTWHRMSVILSAASAFGWITRATGAGDETALLAEIEAAGVGARPDSRLVFLPYLSGERTPHNDAGATGVFFGLDADCKRADLGRAVLEGVAFALADGLAAIEANADAVTRLSVIGGGARSKLWGRILANALQRTLVYHSGGEVGPALGAARLARIAATSLDPAIACPAPQVAHIIEPESNPSPGPSARQALFRKLYPALAPAFASSLSVISGAKS
jgi:xylulokinase